MKIDHLSRNIRPTVVSSTPSEPASLLPRQETRSSIAALTIGGLALALSVAGCNCGSVVIDSNNHGGSGGVATTTTNSGGQGGTGGEPISEVCVPQIIESPLPEDNGNFGIVVAYNPHTKTLAVEQATQQVFIYRNTDQGFQHTQTLSFDDSVKITSGTMAINDQLLVIGEVGLSSGIPGVMIYEYKNNQWSYQTTLEMPGSIPTDLGPRPALKGTRLVVGDPLFSDMQGVAFEFSYDVASKTWNPGKTFNSSLPEGDFGMQVALQDNITVIGDDRANVDGFGSVGQVYVFQDFYLKQAISPDSNYFDAHPAMGNIFALNNGVLVIGSPNENLNLSNTNTKGAAYVYTKALDGTFPFKQKLFGSDNFEFGKFGQDVAVNENGVIIVNDTVLQELHVFSTDTNEIWKKAVVIPYDGGALWLVPNALAVDTQRIVTGLPEHNSANGAVRVDCLPAELQ